MLSCQTQRSVTWNSPLPALIFNQGAAKVLIFPVVQQFTEAFVQALQMPDGPTSDSGFKMEVLKVSWLILIGNDHIHKHCQVCWEGEKVEGCVASPDTACAMSCEAFWLPVPRSLEIQNCAYTEVVCGELHYWVVGLG